MAHEVQILDYEDNDPFIPHMMCADGLATQGARASEATVFA